MPEKWIHTELEGLTREQLEQQLELAIRGQQRTLKANKVLYAQRIKELRRRLDA